jgi:hypothetical protein
MTPVNGSEVGFLTVGAADENSSPPRLSPNRYVPFHSVIPANGSTVAWLTSSAADKNSNSPPTLTQSLRAFLFRYDLGKQTSHHLASAESVSAYPTVAAQPTRPRLLLRVGLLTATAAPAPFSAEGLTRPRRQMNSPHREMLANPYAL